MDLKELLVKPKYRGDKLDIFLSYGHDGFTAVCARLAMLLRSRGHHVWMDEKNLKGGDDWAAEMARGIDSVKASGDKGRFLYMMAPWGVRQGTRDAGGGGFCINELTKAYDEGLHDRMLCVTLCPCEFGSTIPGDMPCLDIRNVFPDEMRLWWHDGRYNKEMAVRDGGGGGGEGVAASPKPSVIRASKLADLMLQVPFNLAVHSVIALLERPMAPGTSVADPEVMRMAAQVAGVDITLARDIKALEYDDISQDLSDALNTSPGASDEVRVFLMGATWTQSLAEHVRDRLPGVIRSDGPRVLVEFRPELLFHEDLGRRSAYIEHALKWAVGDEDEPVKEAETPGAAGAAGGGGGAALETAAAGRVETGGAYQSVPSDDDLDEEAGSAEGGPVGPAASGAGADAIPRQQTGDPGRVVGRAVVLMTKAACEEASAPPTPGQCRPIITQAQTVGCALIPVKVSNCQVPLQIMQLQYIYGTGTMTESEEKAVRDGIKPRIVEAKADSVVADLEKAICMGLDDRGEEAIRARQLEQITQPIDFGRQVGNELAKVPRANLHEQIKSAGGGGPEASPRVVLVSGQSGQGLAEYVAWCAQTQADTAACYFADTGEEHCTSLRRTILTLSHQLCRSVAIQQRGNAPDLLPFRNQVLKPASDGTTPLKLAQTGSDTELLHHFLLRPMQATSDTLASIPAADRGPVRTVLVSKAEAIKSDTGGHTLQRELLRHASHVPEAFRFVLVLREPPLAEAAASPWCRQVGMVPADGGSYAAYIEDMVSHVARKLTEHQESLDPTAVSQWLAAKEREALPTHEDHSRFAREIVVSKGRGNFQYAMRIIKLLQGRRSPVDPAREVHALPDGEKAALVSLLEEKYMHMDGDTGHLRQTLQYEALVPVLEVLAAAQGQLARDELIEVLCLSTRKSGSKSEASKWRALLSSIDSQLASINAARALPIKGTAFQLLCGEDVTHRGFDRIGREPSGSASSAALQAAGGGGGLGGGGDDVLPPPGALQRRSSQLDRLAILHLRQSAGHNMLAAWCYKHFERVLNKCRDNGSVDCSRKVEDDGPIAYSESAFHQLPPYVLQHITTHLETAVRNQIRKAWPLDQSQEDCHDAVFKRAHSYQALRWAQKTVEYREIGLERLYHGVAGLGASKEVAAAAVQRRSAGTFILRWSRSYKSFCTTVSRGRGNFVHRVIYRVIPEAAAGDVAAGEMSDTFHRCSVTQAKGGVPPAPAKTYKDLPAFIAKYTSVPEENEYHLGEAILTDD